MTGSGGFRLGPGGTGPQILPRPPNFLLGSIVISLSRCCLPNDEGPAPNIFFLEPPLMAYCTLRPRDRDSSQYQRIAA